MHFGEKPPERSHGIQPEALAQKITEIPRETQIRLDHCLNRHGLDFHQIGDPAILRDVLSPSQRTILSSIIADIYLHKTDAAALDDNAQRIAQLFS